MADKDTALKLLFANGRVFADFCNGYFFGGEQVLDDSKLSPVDTSLLFYLDGNNVKSLDRDVAKHYIDSKSKKVLATIGIENQSVPNPQMAKRVISYDGGNYRKQVDNNLDEGHVVVTVVINYDKTSAWSPKSLLNSLPQTHDKVVEKLTKEYANDYKVNCFNVRVEDRKEFEKYGMSDLRLLFEVFYDNIHNENKHKDLIDFINKHNNLKIYYPELLALAIYSLTDSEYYKKMFDVATKNINHREGEPYIMCDILKVYSEELLQQGKSEGMLEGKLEERKQTIENLLKFNKSDEEIKLLVPNCTDDLINEVKREFSKESN